MHSSREYESIIYWASDSCSLLNLTTAPRLIHIHQPRVEQREELACVVQVVACDPAEAEGVEIADRHRWENHHRRRDLVQLGDVRVLQVELNPIDADVHEKGQWAEEKHNPEAAFGRDLLIGEDMRDAV